MADLSPFRTMVDLNAPPPLVTLSTPPLDLTSAFFDGWESGWNQDCGASDWDGSDYIVWSIRSLTLFWDGGATWSSGGSADAALPDADRTLRLGRRRVRLPLHLQRRPDDLLRLRRALGADGNAARRGQARLLRRQPDHAALLGPRRDRAAPVHQHQAAPGHRRERAAQPRPAARGPRRSDRPAGRAHAQLHRPAHRRRSARAGRHQRPATRTSSPGQTSGSAANNPVSASSTG